MNKLIKKKNSQRGFVLSFSVLTLALFILIYAQMQAEQQYGLRSQENELEQHTLPFRFANDSKMDLNTLLDERLNVDQNSTFVDLRVSGQLSSPLSMQANLLRYQTNLTALGKDLNLFVFMDLNNTVLDGNITGRTSSGFLWKRKFSSDKIIFQPKQELGDAINPTIPNRMDVNVYSNLPYTSTSPWSLDPSGDVFVVLMYTDQNTGNALTSSGWFTSSGNAKTYVFAYGNGSSQLSVSVGKLNQIDGSLFLDNNNASALTTRYSIHFNFDANTSYTRVGYDIPLTTRGSDANVNESTQWVVE